MAPANVRDDARTVRFRIKAALALLVLYTVMHLTIGGILHLLNPAEPTAARGPDAIATSTETTSAVLYQVDPVYR